MYIRKFAFLFSGSSLSTAYEVGQNVNPPARQKTRNTADSIWNVLSNLTSLSSKTRRLEKPACRSATQPVWRPEEVDEIVFFSI